MADGKLVQGPILTLHHVYFVINSIGMFEYPGTIVRRSPSMAQWNPPPPSTPPQDLSEGYSPEQLNAKDNIGDTVFSKSWVLSLLVMVVKAVQRDEILTHDSRLEDASHEKLRGDEPACLRSSNDVMNGEEDGTCNYSVKGDSSDILLRKEEEKEEERVEEQGKEEEEEEEISEDLENDLCRLWDVSVNHVCYF